MLKCFSKTTVKVINPELSEQKNKMIVSNKIFKRSKNHV